MSKLQIVIEYILSFSPIFLAIFMWLVMRKRDSSEQVSRWGRQPITKCSHKWEIEYSEVFEDNIKVCKYCRQVKKNA